MTAWSILSKKWWLNTSRNLVQPHLTKILKRRVRWTFIRIRNIPLIGSVTQPLPSIGGWYIIKMVSQLFIKWNIWFNVERVNHPFLGSGAIILQWRANQPSQLDLQIFNKPFLEMISLHSYPSKEGSFNIPTSS